MLISPAALKQVVVFLDQHHIAYMVIGGLANAVWGEVRATRDADFKVSIGDLSLSQFYDLITRRFPERGTNAPPHLQDSHIIYVWAMPNVAVDFLVSIFDYEQQAVERATAISIEGVSVRVCTAEDLIIHKATANREKDWIDIEGIVIRQGSKIDQRYVTKWLKQFAAGLDSPQILSRYQTLRKQYIK